jgi:hypothetical protein
MDDVKAFGVALKTNEAKRCPSRRGDTNPSVFLSSEPKPILQARFLHQRTNKGAFTRMLSLVSDEHRRLRSIHRLPPRGDEAESLGKEITSQKLTNPVPNACAAARSCFLGSCRDR